MRDGDRYYENTPFKELRELADRDWEAFCKAVGEDTLKAVLICQLRMKGFTYGQIQNKLKVTKIQVRYYSRPEVCNCKKL